MLRAVLDTSVLASGFRSRTGASFALLVAIRRRRLSLVATTSLFYEYEEVLKREEQRRVSGLSLSDVDRALGVLAVAVEPVEVRLRWKPQLTDPDDEMVLEAAINGRADALVTYNVRDAAPRFGIRILTPAEALKELQL